MSTKDPVEEKSKLVIDALQYAHDHKLDITNRDNVAKMLEALNPEHSENVDEFMKLLQNADTFLEEKAVEKEKTDLPN